MSYTASYFHIVFGTYRRANTLNMSIKESVIQYIGGILRNYKTRLVCANYMPDHVHLLINLSVEVPLSKVVGVVKQSLSLWLKSEGRCPKFLIWSKEYYGVSVSPDNTDVIEKYILNQESHHSVKTFDEELDFLISNAGLTRYPNSFIE